MNKRGFTLVELLIVVTILAILAGAAVPYVSDYVEDAKFARAKVDMDEIKNAIGVYETKRGDVFLINDLFTYMGLAVNYDGVGKPQNTSTAAAGMATPATILANFGYLVRIPADPWGQPYYCEPGSGSIRTYGPDGNPYTGDDLVTAYQPGLGLRSAYWVDANSSNLLDNNDQILLRFTRPLVSYLGNISNSTTAEFTADCSFDNFPTTYISAARGNDYYGKEALLTYVDIDTSDALYLRPGRTVVTIVPDADGEGLSAFNNVACRGDSQRILVR